jgi:hypothetical protein
VLYGNEAGSIAHFVRSVQVAAEVARHDCTTSVIALGDSSAEPILDAVRLAQLEQLGSTRIEYLPFGDNLGHGGGHNRLMEAAREDLVLVINPDTVLAPHAVRELVSGLVKGVGATEARQVPFEHPKAYDPQTGDTPWASGACTLIRAGVYRSVGGFDADNFFLHGDDVDLGWRIRLAGNRIRYIPQAAVFHDKRLTRSGAVDTTGQAERYESHLAGLMLAHKWGQPAITNHLRHFCADADDPLLNSVAREWDRRARSNELPQPVSGAESVAQFVGSYYAEHRF